MTRWLLGFWVAGLLTAPAWWRETNSHAASARGAKAYEEQKYAEAVKAFERARQIAPSARGAFNLGTAQIASGQREQGSATLTESMDDVALRPEALFNRGNSALAAKSFDRAVEDYIEALKLKPEHAGAKRNLEIALLRREQQRRESESQNRNRPGDNEQQQQRAPSQGQQPPRGQPDLEALLRSVQQQEQEELRRMKAKVAAEGRVGW
ncbi:MAG TPA: tetratricopeptide repeat protein [Thermoanaerobaculia bacterium]|nr:tetratricopeptide repeat protein [Thermoanaerobaculia bacterium]